jgi:hypothetical protein
MRGMPPLIGATRTVIPLVRSVGSTSRARPSSPVTTSPSELVRDRTGPEGLVESSGRHQTGPPVPDRMTQRGQRTPSPCASTVIQRMTVGGFG